MHDQLENYAAGLRDALARIPLQELGSAADWMLDCYRRGGTSFIAGNGGSAATASHFACDLTKGTRQEGTRRFRVVALTDNIPLMTAWGNDASFDRIFAEQLIPLAGPSDILLVITASGNSPNVIEALATAKAMGTRSIAFTGPAGGRAAEMADLTVRAPAETIEQVEDVHSAMTHALTVTLREALRRETYLEERSSTKLP